MYAKGYYFYSDCIEDLKKIQAEYTMSDPSSISIGDILSVFHDIIVDRFKNDSNGLAKFYHRLLEKSTRFVPKEYRWESVLAYQAIIDAVILIMMETTKDNIDGELGKPNPDILPLHR
jgi:hypothetical protein